MRILQVLTDGDRRGAQMFAVRLAAALGPRGWQVRTVGLTAGRRPRPLPVPVLGPSRRAPATLRALRAEIRRADVVVAFGSTTLPASVLAGAGLGVPIVYRSIGDAWHWADTPRRRAQLRALFSRTTAVCALWPQAADALVTQLGVAPERVAIIPTGVPTDRAAPPSAAERDHARRHLGLRPDAPTVVFVGALAREKRVDRLIDAVSAEPTWQLLVVGDGPLGDALRTRAAAGARHRVVFAGALADATAAYVAADVVALLSETEGTPGVLLEAALHGVPSAATAVGGVPSIIDHGRTGVLMPADPDPMQVRAAIGKALTDRGGLGGAARAHVLARFDLEVVADAWSDLLTAARSVHPTHPTGSEQPR